MDQKRKSADKAPRQEKKQRKGKDPNQPKRPPSAFFVFMEEFRKTYKEMHPDVKSVSTVGKAGGHKWNEMNEEEKAPYVSVAADRKMQYEKSMAAYMNKEDGSEEEE